MIAAIWGYSIGEIAIAIVVIAAIVAIVIVALRYFEVSPPPWVVKIFWICVVAFVAIVAIKFLVSL